MNKNEKISHFHTLICILATVLCCLTIIRGYIIAGRQIRNVRNPEIMSFSALKDLNDSWILHHSDGTTEKIHLPYNFTSKEEEIFISRKTDGIFQDGDVIKFDNNRQGVTVKANDTVIYEVNTTSLTNQLSFTDYQVITIPDAEKVSELSLTFSHRITDSFSIPSISYGSYFTASSELVHNDLLTLFILVILILVLIAVVIIHIYCCLSNISDPRVFDLAIFVLTAILWGLTDSYLPILLNIPQEVLGLICYFSIMALPLSICQFVARSCQKNYKVFDVILIIGAINLILQAIFSFLGIIQLQNTFYFAHVLIIAVIAVSIICIYKTRKSNYSMEMDILYFGILLLAIISLVSLILYWQKGGMYYRICMLIGILFFSVILFAYVLFHYVKMVHTHQLELSEIKIHERLSMYDELTGLPNRRFFEEKMKEIENADHALDDALLIMMDVNGLKIVNDKYGHSAGDDLIISAAEVIRQTFGDHATCCRIGGDEFVIILEDLSIPFAIYNHSFDENIAKVNENSRWKLSIARGVSHLVHPSGQRLTISDWKQEADVNMYRNKVSMTGGYSRDLAKDLREIIRCIITTVEAKDMYTAAHSDRVRELSSCIAKNLGVSGSTLQIIETAAMLHDLGKIGIPDYVLLKPDTLNPEEYEIIKQHSTIGANIIGQAKGMQEIANIVLHHHERWDGNGYPERLKENEIPLESRIIALADSIDAMTSRRIYRDSLPIDLCREEIKKNSGIMYDPAITQIILQNWNEIVDIVMLHPKRLINDPDRGTVLLSDPK